MKRIKKLAGKYLSSILAMFLMANLISAAAVVRKASGANNVAINAAVELFRIDLGGQLNPNTMQTFPNGRREINWDDVPEVSAYPSSIPGHYYNTISPRGVILSTPLNNWNLNTGNFIVSTGLNPGPTRFENIDPSYDNALRLYSGERIASVRYFPGVESPSVINVNFFIPGTDTPATVSGFGIVFTDVDSVENTTVRFFGVDGRVLTGIQSPLPANNGLSFIGVSYNAGERIARVEIKCGKDPLKLGNVDGQNGIDVVAMDDMIYGEPRAAEFHPGDFDGDGASDSAIYRPGNGTWYILNSGTNTLRIAQWGINGDVPLSGDFDGDALADLAIFRPANGVWFINSSSNGATLGRQFGQNGDRPVVSDYDQDRRSDIAIWRPSDGNFYVSGSIDNFTNFYAYPFGTNGDIPVGSGVIP